MGARQMLETYDVYMQADGLMIGGGGFDHGKL